MVRRSLLSVMALALLVPGVGWAQDGAATPAAKIPAQASAVPKADHDKPVDLATIKQPILWHDPGDIGSLDLFYGAGGKDGMPQPPFKFVSEDLNGTNPKFNADDASGKSWRVKVGPEARPEVVASRLLWAMGFNVNTDYVMDADVAGIKMKRHSPMMVGDHVTDARFEHKPDGQKKIGIWEWKKNPFNHTREFNGLRVMMAVMNSWDLKDVNNAVYRDKKNGHDYFLISDVGATFATNGIVLPIKHSKGDLDSFRKSKFITKQTATTVSFATPSAPTGMLLETFGGATREFVSRKGYEWIGQDIPKADAKWMGEMLGKLSAQQISDAFRAGHFPADATVEYSILLGNRIQELMALQ